MRFAFVLVLIGWCLCEGSPAIESMANRSNQDKYKGSPYNGVQVQFRNKHGSMRVKDVKSSYEEDTFVLISATKEISNQYFMKSNRFSHQYVCHLYEEMFLTESSHDAMACLWELVFIKGKPLMQIKALDVTVGFVAHTNYTFLMPKKSATDDNLFRLIHFPTKMRRIGLVAKPTGPTFDEW